jgi:hypothetical protein
MNLIVNGVGWNGTVVCYGSDSLGVIISVVAILFFLLGVFGHWIYIKYLGW